MKVYAVMFCPLYDREETRLEFVDVEDSKTPQELIDGINEALATDWWFNCLVR